MKVAVLFVAAFSLTAALAVVGPEANPPRKKSVETRKPAPQQQILHTPAVAAEKTAGNKQTPDDVAAYLETLLAREVPLPEHYKAHLEAEAKIDKALSRRIDLDFVDKPLRDVVRFFREELDINLQLDEKVLEEASIDTNESLTLHAEKITARSALEFVLWNLSEPLTWIVEFEIALITTLEEADARMTINFYDVSDLVITKDENGELILGYGRLKTTIIAGCDENAIWFEYDDEGGTISPFDAPGIHCLVIRQTRAIHDEIEVILAGLRRLRKKDPEVFRNTKRAPRMIPPSWGQE